MDNKKILKTLSISAFCLLASQYSLFAWAPPVSEAVCGYCDKANGHETWCPSYKSQQSTSLADYVPVQALPYIPSPCPICNGSGGRHEFNCKIGEEIKKYNSASKNYDNANDVYARKISANNMKDCVDKINRYLSEAKAKVNEEERRNNDPLWISNDEWCKEDKHSILYYCNLGGYLPKFTYSTGRFSGGCDKKIEFNIKGSCIALGKTAPNGAEDWHFVNSIGNGTLSSSGLGARSYESVKAVDMTDQQYYLVKPKLKGQNICYLANTDGSRILHIAKSFEPICKSVPMFQGDFTGERGTSKDLWFICEEDNSFNRNPFYFYNPKKDKRSEGYEYIDKYCLGSVHTKCMVKVRRNGCFGIVIPCPESNYRDKVIVPLKYVLVKERWSANTKLPFYIVNPDGKSNHFGAYDGNGNMVLQCIYSNGEVERRIDSKNFR